MKKRTTALAFAFVLGIGLSGRLIAAEADAAGPVVIRDQGTMRATVVAIDHDARTVTLKGPQGNTVDLTVDKAVTRFDAMKVGDTVMAGYSESATFEVVPPGTPAEPDSIVRGGGKISGEKPGGAAADTTVRTVTITGIDKAKSLVTIKSSDGAKETHHVEHPEYLDRFKVGQMVKVTRTSALLIKVEGAQ